MDRGERRARNARYGARVRSVKLSTYNGERWVGDRTAYSYRKGKALGCRGSKKGAAGTSKLGSCCKGGFELRATVHARHAGRRLCRDWQAWSGEWDDYVEPREIGRARDYYKQMF